MNANHLPPSDDRYRGKRYINLLRCSNLSQADTSPEGQKTFNDAFSQNLGMTWTDDFRAEGVSGSQTFNRDDIEALIRRKQEKDDFDVLVVFELARLTRGGIRHGNVVEDRLRKAGITLLSATDAIPEGPEGDLIKSVRHFSNQLQARSISLAVARGLGQSLERQDRPAASRTPYALDRLFRGPDGKPRMLIRWDANIQLWLRPDENGQPVEEVGRRVKPPRHGRQGKKIKRERFRGYAKQPDEVSELVPGAADRLKTLVFIFTAYDLNRWGYHRIAQNLNRRGIPAPEGGDWTLSTVRKILFNPIYLGIEVRHRFSGALYHKLSPKGPVPVSVDQDKLAAEHRKTVPVLERPREEWQLVDQPQLKSLLPPAVREAAMRRILESLDPDRKPHPKKGVPVHLGEVARQRHLDSPFLLTHLLRCRQTGHPMRGDTVNKKLKSGRKIYRYYFDGSAAVFARGQGAARRVPAQPLEQAVVEAVWQTLNDSDYLAQRVRQLTQAPPPDPQLDEQRLALEREREKLTLRLKQAYSLLGELAGQELADEIAADKKRLRAIDEQLKTLEQPSALAGDPEELTQAVLARLRQLPEDWQTLPNAQLKQLLAAAVEDLTLDLKTLELTFTLVLPQPLGRLDGEAEDGGKVRLGYTWPCPSQAETNRPQSLKIDAYRCEHQLQGRQDCYKCRRRPAA